MPDKKAIDKIVIALELSTGKHWYYKAAGNGLKVSYTLNSQEPTHGVDKTKRSGKGGRQSAYGRCTVTTLLGAQTWATSHSKWVPSYVSDLFIDFFAAVKRDQ
jgi:hypothetical protein